MMILKKYCFFITIEQGHEFEWMCLFVLKTVKIHFKSKIPYIKRVVYRFILIYFYCKATLQQCKSVKSSIEIKRD